MRFWKKGNTEEKEKKKNKRLCTTAALRILGPWLRSPTDNPHATLIGLYQDAINGMRTPGLYSQQEQIAASTTALEHITPSVHNTASELERRRAGYAAWKFMDFEEKFDQYMRKYVFSESRRGCCCRALTHDC